MVGKISELTASPASALLDAVEVSEDLAASPVTKRVSIAQIKEPYVYNKTPDNLKKFHNALNTMIDTGANAKINLYGDSITLGTGGDLAANSIGQRLAELFSTAGYTALNHKLALHSSTGATTTYDGRFKTFTGTWDGWTALPGGLTFRATADASTMVYAPGYSHDTVDFYWYRNNTAGHGGLAVITIDAGAANFDIGGGSVSSANVDTNGTPSIQKTTITYDAAGTREITITRNDAADNIEIVGFEAYTAGTPTVLIRTNGFSGYTSVNYVAGSIEQRLWDAAITPHINVLNIGSNDAATAVALATYAANMVTLSANLNVFSESMMFWSWPTIAIGTVDIATQETYRDAMITAAETDTVVADLWQRYLDFGGQAELVKNSGSGLMDDTQHPSHLGNMDIAKFLFNAMMPDYHA